MVDPGPAESFRGHSRHGAKKIEKKPVSSKRMSHWKVKKSCPAIVSDKYKNESSNERNHRDDSENQ